MIKKYTVKLIVGLGNTGEHFTGTRHNVGFAALDSFAKVHGIDWHTKEKFKAHVAEGNVLGQKVLLLKPTTYYNLSGEAVRAAQDFYKIDPSDILIIHDELALSFGTVRTRIGGSDAGNNGIKSIIAHVGQDVARIRVGIANEHAPHHNAADFVLAPFSHDENTQLKDILAHVHTFVDNFISGDFSATTKKNQSP